MNLNEAKKELYRKKPMAYLYAKTDTGFWLYDCVIDKTQIMFAVPVSDMGEKTFNDTEPGQLLIRYITSLNQLTK